MTAGRVGLGRLLETEMDAESYVFISYSRRDKEYVARLAEFLQARDISVWYDPDIPNGARWRLIIQDRLERAAALLLIQSASALESDWVDNEFSYAQEMRKPILTLLLDTTPGFGYRHLQGETVSAGIMPSAEFVAQARQVLAGDAVVIRTKPSSIGVAVAVPRAVGTPVAHGLELFKDRVTERAEVRRLLRPASIRMVAVIGRRGIGKSALASKILEELLDHVDGSHEPVTAGAVLVSSRTDGLSVERVFLDCAEVLGGASAEHLRAVWSSQRGLRQKLAELVKAFSTRRCFILLDNLEESQAADGTIVDEELQLFVDYLFRTRHELRLLVTSQRPVVVEPALRRQLDQVRLDAGLPDEDAVALLRELDPTGDAGLRDGDVVDLARAARQVYGVPRALELIAGVLLDDYASLPRLDEVLATFTSRGDVVYELANMSYRRLSTEAQLIPQILAVFRTPVGFEPIDFVARRIQSDIDTAGLLAHLARINMVTVDRAARTYCLHPMDADISYAALPEEGQHSQPVLELLAADWYATRMTDAESWVGLEDVVDARAEFEHRVRGGDYHEAARLLNEVGRFLVWRGAARSVLDMYDKVRNRSGLDPRTIAYNRVAAAFAYMIRGPLDASLPLLASAVELLEPLADQPGLQLALADQGDVLRRFGRLDEAVPILERAAHIAAEFSPPQTHAQTLFILCLAYSYRGDVELAQGVIDQLDAIATQTGRADIQGWMLDSRCCLYTAQRRWPEALTAAQHALQWYRQAKIVEPVPYVLNTAGLAYLGLNQPELAASTLLEAVHDESVSENPRPRGFCLFNLAWAYWQLGDIVAALATAALARDALAEYGADNEAGEALARATQARADGNLPLAAQQLRIAATGSARNADLAPFEWLRAEADRLDTEPVTQPS
jgi:tetratricopeptide (TPR) repeat protein